MSKGDNSPGISKLAGAIKKVAEKGKDTSLLLDFGTIMEDYSLLTNTYPIPIPPSDYLVCRNAVLPESEVVSTEETTAEDNPHSHGYTEQSTAEGQTGTVDGHSHPVTIQLSPVRTASVTTTQKPHPHDVDIARASQRSIMPGDTVLVAWVQNDAVVIDIVYEAGGIF